MSKFRYSRNGAGFSGTRQEKDPFPALCSRPGLLPFSPRTSRLGQPCPPTKSFLIS